jgi:hypothetical protein
VTKNVGYVILDIVWVVASTVLLVPSLLLTLSVEDALRLYHYMNGLKTCSERCIELWLPPDESAKGTCSESEQIENRCERRTSSGTANDISL